MEAQGIATKIKDKRYKPTESIGRRKMMAKMRSKDILTSYPSMENLQSSRWYSKKAPDGSNFAFKWR